MAKSFFLTGTDTNIGKTLAACALLQFFVRSGCRAIGYKPVAAGCELTLEGLRNHDALALMANSNVALSYQQVNPVALFAATSPHIASRNEGKQIDFTILSTGLQVLETMTDWLIIEGAGGWFTPLSESLTYADWVITERLPVIMVVGIKIGCINHALLTALAIKDAGLSLVGWIANHPMLLTTGYYLEDYLITLQQRLCVPLLGKIPWLSGAEKTPLAHYINGLTLYL